VEQILAFEVDLRAVAVAQVPYVIERRRPARELREQLAKPVAKAVGPAQLVVRRRQLRERVEQRFGNVSAAVSAELSIGNGRPTAPGEK